MLKKSRKLAGLLVLAFVASCAGQSTEIPDNPKDTGMESNILLADWTGPYGGVPAFDRMDLEALKPALEVGMRENLEEIDAIANNPKAATLENTILAMERSGRSRGFEPIRENIEISLMAVRRTPQL